jgi:Domain of unknown function (DUF4430)
MSIRNRIRVSIVLVACASLAAIACKGEDRPANASTLSVTVQIQAEVAGPAHAVEAPAGATALDALARLQSAGALSYTTQGAGAQTLVTGIDGKSNSAEGKNWLFAINGELSVQGAGAYQLQAGDRIVWCYVAWADRNSCGKTAAGVAH